jgi:flagellin-like protein
MEDWQMMKKIWKDEEAVSPVIAVILMVAITVVLAAVLYVWAQSFAGDTKGVTTIAWGMEEHGGDYLISITTVEPTPLEDVTWTILDENRIIADKDDPGTLNVRMDGNLDEILWDVGERDDADVTVEDRWYSQDPDADPVASNNHTLYIVYIDTDEDGKLSSGDSIWIRSYENDDPLAGRGIAEEDFRFRMVNDNNGNQYGNDLIMLGT